MRHDVCAFLLKHNFVRRIDINAVVASLLYDMDNGIKGLPSDLAMLKTWCVPPEKHIKNESTIVIDAGGTNFRSGIVSFDDAGNPSVCEFEKTTMPGVGQKLGKADFFDRMAENLDHVKNKADKIGFCFSYPIEITPDGDGILLNFSKEINAPEVVGSAVGKELCAALVKRGWKRPKKITLLNDTVAALLGGAAVADKGKSYSSYVGFILGTGMNSAYIQPETALDGGKKFIKQIVVCESGGFAKIYLSDFDKVLDKKTIRPGSFLLEKQCSGAYLGSLALEVIRSAAEENLFSPPVCKEISAFKDLSLIEVDSFLHSPHSKNHKIGALCALSCDQDLEILYELLDSVVERSARYAAALLCAAVIQSGEGKDPSRPVCIMCNGTTFHKTHKVSSRCAAYLEEFLFYQRGLSYELVSKENDITYGSAVAGLTDRIV
ncbi:hexokinase [Treponema parvum]|uniref:hexokinase n=1 Tax=Treponema parvum TaxID=138851 RepID=UPI001AEBBF3F|nr:hexokinase [Treponema parvum]QTQ15922.1 hexokinase [Treponema parvum]